MTIDEPVFREEYDPWSAPEDWNKPNQPSKCNSDMCKKIFQNFWTKKQLRQIEFGENRIISLYDWEKLCPYCQDAVYTWYYDVAYSDHPEYLQSLKEFELMIRDQDERYQEEMSSRSDPNEWIDNYEYVPEWEQA